VFWSAHPKISYLQEPESVLASLMKLLALESVQPNTTYVQKPWRSRVANELKFRASADWQPSTPAKHVNAKVAMGS